MKEMEFIEGKQCLVFADSKPRAILVQPLERQEQKLIDGEVEMIREAVDCPFVMAAVTIDDWQAELSPWHDTAVSRREIVGSGAGETLRFVKDALVPRLYDTFGQLPVILGGYSLGGLFSLWAASETDGFDGVAAVSPSVWIAGWLEYAERHPVKAKDVYLSLGDQEEHVRNRFFKKVGDNIRAEHKLLVSQLGDGHCTLEWNEGNHFMDGDRRTARGFAWCLGKI